MMLIARGLVALGGGRRLLGGVELVLRPRTVTVILGENGAGKSTLLDRLAGLVPPDEGEVLLSDEGADRDLGSLDVGERARLVASLGQEDIVPTGLAVAARIGQGLAPRRGPGRLLDDEALGRIARLAEAVRIEHLLDRDLASLSGGERRRAHLARALIDDEARVVLLDEPHAGVDLRHRPLVDEAIRARARGGAAIALSAHDLEVAESLADEVVGLREGNVVVRGPPSAVLVPEQLERIYGVAFERRPSARPAGEAPKNAGSGAR